MDEKNYDLEYNILVAMIGGVSVSLPISDCYNLIKEANEYCLIDGTIIYGQYVAGTFIIRIFDSKSEIMKNVLKCMSLVTCYDFSKQTNAVEPSDDDNMEVGRILRPTSQIKMWGK